MTHQVVPVRTYAAVFLGLLVLTVTTVAVSRLELGEYNFICAISIAIVKASLVLWFFMDLRRSTSMTRLFVGAGLFWLAIMLALTLSDYWSRGWVPAPRWW